MISSTAVLSLKAFGAPEVRYAGREVRFRSRKELALLIYLAVAGGQHSREKLMALLWPDGDRKLSQAALRNTLSRVRRALDGASECLSVRPDVVSFDRSRLLECDVTVVETALRSLVDTPRRTALPDLTTLEAAVSAYRGEFLDGFSLADAPDFDDWAGRQREAWHRNLERIFSRLSRLQFEGSQIDRAIDTTERWIEHNPLNEAAYRRLMQIYFLAGDRPAALDSFERCRSTLMAELGVEPAAETLALAERIRTEALPTGATDKQEPALFQELPFVGRVTEHARLVAAHEAAARGEPQVVCLLGEAGIGKTRLAQTFLAWATIQRADTLSGRSFEAGGRLPYGPLVAAMRERIERETSPDDLLADVWLAELSRLLPEVRDRYPDLSMPTHGDSNLARAHLFEAVAQLGRALAQRAPVVLWIDDLQWADASTLEILPYLCRRWTEARSRILLLVALRDESLLAAPGLREWLAQLGREVTMTRIRLQPLTPDATRQMVHGLGDPWAGGLAASRQFSDWLFVETAGQPYFMAETVKMLVELDILQAARGRGGWTIDFERAVRQIGSQGQLPLPPSVREVILARLDRVSETAGVLLEAGAVLGRACAFEELCQVAGLDELAGLPGLDELLRSQLLVEAGDTHEPYTLAHEKIRDVAYAEAGEARRRIFHRRAFESSQAAGAPAAELAHHAVAARMPEPAYRYSLAAGDEAASVYACDEAAQHYRRALDLALEDGAGTHTGVTAGKPPTPLFLQLGRTLELASRYDDALATYRDLEALAGERGDRAMELAALLAQITPLATVTAVFDPVRGDQVAERALELARSLGDQAAEADILWNRLVSYRSTNRLGDAVVAGENALELARRLDRRERLAFILHDLGYCFAFMADHGRAMAYFGEAEALWRTFGNLPMLADTLIGTCFVCGYAGKYETAIDAHEEALEIGTKTGSAWTLAGCRHNIGFVLSDRGEVERALGEMEEGIRLSEQVGFLSPPITIRCDLARLYCSLGATEQALGPARLALEIAESRLPALRIYALAVLVHLEITRGKIAEAEALVEQLQTDPNRNALGIYHVLIPLGEAELALAQRRFEQASELAGDALGAARASGARAFLPSVLDLQAQAWLGRNRPDLAREAWQEAALEAEALGARRRLWPILLALSELVDNQVEAAQLRMRAREVVAFIAEQTPPELQAAFRSHPKVRTLFEEPRGRFLGDVDVVRPSGSLTRRRY